MHFAPGGGKKHRAEAVMCMAGSWVSDSLSSWTGQTEHRPFQKESRTSEGFVPSVLSVSGNTAQLTSSWFHSSECYQLCIKCGWRARFSATPSRQSLHSAVLPFLTHKESHLIFLIPVSPFLFFLSGINLSPQQTTALLKRGSAPFSQEQVANARKTPCVAGYRFQILIGVTSMEIHVTFQCVQCERDLFFPLQTRKEEMFCKEFHAEACKHLSVCLCVWSTSDFFNHCLAFSVTVKISAAVPLKILSSFTSGGIRWPSSEYPI